MTPLALWKQTNTECIAYDSTDVMAVPTGFFEPYSFLSSHGWSAVLGVSWLKTDFLWSLSETALRSHTNILPCHSVSLQDCPSHRDTSTSGLGIHSALAWLQLNPVLFPNKVTLRVTGSKRIKLFLGLGENTYFNPSCHVLSCFQRC